MKKLSKSEKKSIIRKMEFDEEVRIAISKARNRYEDISWYGIGQKVAQIIIEPSFEISHGWDIREQKEKLVVYEYTLNEMGDKIKPGYFLLDSNHIKIKEILNIFYEIPINLNMPKTNYSTDGTNFEIALFSSEQSIRLTWKKENSHDIWPKINSNTINAINYFKSLKRLKNGD